MLCCGLATSFQNHAGRSDAQLKASIRAAVQDERISLVSTRKIGVIIEACPGRRP